MAYVFQSCHGLVYTTNLLPTTDDVISSLSGLERIACRVPDVMRQLIPRGPVTIEVYVSQVKAGSLIEDILFKIFFRDEKHFKKWAKAFREKTGVELMSDKLQVLGPIITGLVVVGIGYGAVRMLGREGAGNGSTVHIESVSQSVINTGAVMINLPPEAYLQALQSGGGNMLNLASNACRIVKPAKRAEAVVPCITVDGNTNLVLTGGVIAEAPSHVDRSVVVPEMQLLQDEEIIVRALDLDNPKKGWAVVVPRFFEKRVVLDLAPSVDTARITAGRRIKADIELYYVLDDEGNRKYKTAHVRAIN